MTQATHQKQVAWQGDDFPSWLSPIIVKELRQGLQSGVFAWTFIGLQAALFLVLTFAFTLFTSVTDGSGRRFIDTTFWILLGAGVLVIIPLRGLTVISGEHAGDKLDLLMLTRLSATKIVVGKWLAIVVQGTLVVISFLPYVVLRYFFGNVNIIGELVGVGWLFLLSTLIAATTIALSGLPIWARIGIGALLIPIAMLIVQILDAYSSALFDDLPTILGAIASVVLYTLTLLEVATSKIAPIAENHAMRKRLIALGIGLAWLCTSIWGSLAVATWTILVTFPLAMIIMIAAVLERPVHLKSHAEAFSRFGMLGQLAAQLLIPGWHSGVIFVFAMSAMFLPVLWQVSAGWTDAPRVVWFAYGVVILAAVIFPLPLLARFPRLRYQALGYALVHILSLLAFSFTYACIPNGLKWHEWRAAWSALTVLPVASLASLLACSSVTSAVSIADTTAVVSAVITAIVCIVVLQPWLMEIRITNRLIADAQPAKRTRATAPSVSSGDPSTSMGAAE